MLYLIYHILSVHIIIVIIVVVVVVIILEIVTRNKQISKLETWRILIAINAREE